MDESLEVALRAAEDVDNEPISARDVPAPHQTASVDDYDAFARAIEVLNSGASRAIEDGLIDLLGSELLSSVLTGDAPALDLVAENVYRAQQAAERGMLGVAGDHAVALELAESAGALRALSWMARLAAEHLIGPALIDAETHAGRILATIVKEPGVASSKLISGLALDKTEVSRTGRRLIEAGLAVSARSGKSTVWHATPKGQAAVRAAQDDAATPRPLIADAIGGFESKGWEEIGSGDNVRDGDVMLGATADGNTVLGTRIKELGEGAKRTATAGKDSLTEMFDRLTGPGGPKMWSARSVVLRQKPGKQRMKGGFFEYPHRSYGDEVRVNPKHKTRG